MYSSLLIVIQKFSTFSSQAMRLFKLILFRNKAESKGEYLHAINVNISPLKLKLMLQYG